MDKINSYEIETIEVLEERLGKANNHVNSVIVEYIEGIKVVKTFNQTSASYKKFTRAFLR